MHRFRNILVPIDGDPSRQPVLARAARLAKQNGASIKLIAVVEDLPWYTRLVLPNAEELQTVLVRDRSEVLERLAEQLRQDGLDSRHGSPQGPSPPGVGAGGAEGRT